MKVIDLIKNYNDKEMANILATGFPSEGYNSCDGIDCTECSGFYMCHSKLANDVLKLLDIKEIDD